MPTFGTNQMSWTRENQMPDKITVYGTEANLAQVFSIDVIVQYDRHNHRLIIKKPSGQVVINLNSQDKKK